MASLEWYYAKDNKQHGPVSAEEVKQLVERGKLKPGDLVWREGMGEWAPARKDPKLRGLFASDIPAPPPRRAKPHRKAAPTGGVPPVFRKSPAVFAPSQRRPFRHLFDVVLQFTRSQFTSAFVELTTRIFTLAGHYGLYLAMALLFVFSLLLGVTTGRGNTILLGMAAVVILFVLQYAARHFSAALERLNRSTPARMCSAAFLDCYALLHMFGGLVALLALAVLAVQTGPLSLALAAIGTFILCQYVAVVALNPESLNLTITSDATAGEEAIGVLSFLVKLSLRIVPVAFGVGVVYGTLALLYAALLVFIPPEGREEITAFVGPERFAALEASVDPASLEEAMKAWPAQEKASGARTILIISAALPFLTYVLFLVGYLLIDVLRAILSLPGKLEKTKEIDD